MIRETIVYSRIEQQISLKKIFYSTYCTVAYCMLGANSRAGEVVFAMK